MGDNQPVMRLLLYQPNHEGHHLPYLARLLPAFLDLPIEVVVATTPEAARSEEFERALAPIAHRFELAPVAQPIPPGVLRGALHRLRDLRRVVRSLRPDHVGVLYGDGLWQLMAAAHLTGPLGRALVLPDLFLPDLAVPTELWLYRGGFTYPDARFPADHLKRALFHSLLRRGSLAALHLDDEYLYDYARLVPSRTRVFLTPNPVSPPTGSGSQDATDATVARARAREALGLPTSGRLISLTGMIDHRKGAHLLAEAFSRIAAQPGFGDVRLAFGGPHRPPFRELLTTAPYDALVAAGRIASVDRFLSQDEMAWFAQASDLVVAPYPHHSGRSSIILWAAAAGRPSLGAQRGVIGRVIRDHGLGWTADPTQVPAFARALAAALEHPWTAADAARARRYAATHAPARYTQQAATLVRERLRGRLDSSP